MKKMSTLTITAVLLVSYQNCSPEKSSFDASSIAPIRTTASTEPTPVPTPTVRDTKAIGVNYSENLLTAMQMQTGVTTLSTRTRTKANTELGKVPDSGKPDSVTAPMWIAVTNLSGEVCADLLAQEKAIATVTSRRIFPMVDFAKGPVGLTPAAKDDVIRRMARSFWARNESATEKLAIRTALDSAFSPTSTNTNDTNNAMLFVCTAMLASLDAQKQ